jgi:sugar-specific transcriptional regulator TrmB
LQENTVEKALQNFGLTEKETQIYIYLAKHGLQKGGNIAKATKTAKAVVYRVLKILHRKGFVESTLESPVRYKAVPFESILDSEIKSKHEEARQIEAARKSLLIDWNKISKGEHESPIEKFVTIEGDQKIYSKIYQMVKQTKQQISIIATVSGIMRSDRYGITNEIINHPLRNKIKFRFLTDITNADIRAIQFLKKKLKTGVDLRGRNPDLGLKPFPRMVIRDQEEILFFITPKPNQTGLKTDDTCLCTNCKSMIQAFSGVFEDFWVHSTEIEKKIIEVQTGKLPSKTVVINNAKKAETQYFDTLSDAKREILIVTSSTGLVELSKQVSLLQDWTEGNVAIKIMAPITNENLAVAQRLLECCEIRHVPFGYFETTIIDGKCLFQFNTPSLGEKLSEETKFENTLYSNEINYVQKTKELLTDIWLKTRMPLSERADSVVSTFGTQPKSSVNHHNLLKKTSFMREMGTKQTEEISSINVLSKIEKEKESANAKRSTWSDTLRYFGSVATAIIEPPKSFNLPKMVFSFCRHDEPSSFGAENYIIVHLRQEPCGELRYIPFAMILDRPEPLEIRKALLKGFPAENNILVFEKNEIQFRLKGNTFFAGWTRPIPLGTERYSIPPSCVLFEGYGDVKSGCFNNVLLSGRRQEVWYNSFNAFVSYFHPQSKYVGSGTEGYIEKDWVLISRPPN